MLLTGRSFCRLMHRRIKVADPRIFLIYAAYMHIGEEVVNEYHYEHLLNLNPSFFIIFTVSPVLYCKKKL